MKDAWAIPHPPGLLLSWNVCIWSPVERRMGHVAVGGSDVVKRIERLLLASAWADVGCCSVRPVGRRTRLPMGYY